MQARKRKRLSRTSVASDSDESTRDRGTGKERERDVEEHEPQPSDHPTDQGLYPVESSRMAEARLHDSEAQESEAQTVTSSENDLSRRNLQPSPHVESNEPPSQTEELLSSYCCPICFCPPTNATLTPCGHICCGSCLFAAVKTTMHRARVMVQANEAVLPRCPVCRAVIPGWDGRGGGVIGLKTRAVLSL